VALASMVNTMGTLFWMRTDNVNMVGALDHLTDPEVSAMMLSRPIDWLETGVLPQAQLCSILYEDLVADPINTVERMYRQFDLVLSKSARAAMENRLRAHPRAMRPRHGYRLSANPQESRERQAYRRYQEYFKVPSET
jgi:hypothetical protein